ncbi:MAG: efflux RND transporter periplasmic adaptor subunit [Thermoguttaceae bacterium]
MTTRSLRPSFAGKARTWILGSVLVLVAGIGIAYLWLPQVRQLAISTLSGIRQAHFEDDGHEHAGESADAHGHEEAGHAEEGDAEVGHGHAEHSDDDPDAQGHVGETTYDHVHDEAAAITLSRQARGNIGLRTEKVELKPFERTISVPGIVVERPGWSVLEVTAPMTGVVTRVYPIEGEAVEPGQSLFEVRLTHEDLLQLQTEFLRTIEELDVIGREVARLEKASSDGIIAGKTLLERKYEQQKQEAALKAQRQALLLHGLSQEQVDTIVAERSLLQSLTIYAPLPAATEAAAKHPLQVQQLEANQGKHVTAGDTLCTLVDYGELYIEGRAFEQDIHAVNQAAIAAAEVSAVLGAASTAEEETVEGLRILYLSDKVDSEARALHFYLQLSNRVLREDKSRDGRRFVYWQFKPGQRTQIRVPVEQWKDRIVLPVEAVAQDGAEAYVFEANDDHFDRRPVHVEYRDRDWVVIANDGALKVGTTVAASAAHQVQLALKSKSGGGFDPHAGHNH